MSLEATLIQEMGAKGQMLLTPVFQMDHSWRSSACASVELLMHTFIAFLSCVTGPACSLLLPEITSQINLLHPSSHSKLYLGEEIVGQKLYHDQADNI